MEREAALIEAILFLETEPIEVAKLVKISQLSTELVTACLDILRLKYSRDDSGIELLQTGEALSLIPRQSLWDGLKAIYGKKTDDKMSRAALETLSIIAYSQPMTKAEIESIRGVNAAGIIKLLLERDMIKEVGRKDGPGKPVQYGTTKEFLRYFKLSSISDLPKLDDDEREKFELNATD